RGENVVVGEMDLERRDTGDRALRRTDLGREVGQRRQVVAEGGGLRGEPITGQLHAVAGVAGEPDDDPVELLDRASTVSGSLLRGGFAGGHVNEGIPLCASGASSPRS